VRLRKTRLGDRRVVAPLSWLILGVALVGCTQSGDNPLSAVAEGMQNLGDRVTGDSLHDEMTDQDVELAVATMQRALDTRPNGGTMSWTNADSGNSGVIRPIDAVMTEGGYPCRRYEERLTVDARTASYESRACRNDAGRWIWLE